MRHPQILKSQINRPLLFLYCPPPPAEETCFEGKRKMHWRCAWGSYLLVLCVFVGRTSSTLCLVSRKSISLPIRTHWSLENNVPSQSAFGFLKLGHWGDGTVLSHANNSHQLWRQNVHVQPGSLISRMVQTHFTLQQVIDRSVSIPTPGEGILWHQDTQNRRTQSHLHIRVC